MKAIVKKALGDTEAVRFRLLLEHYTKLQSGLKSSLDESDVIPILNRISPISGARLTNTLRATSYGMAIVQLSLAGYEVELEKLLGGCRLLRALMALRNFLALEDFEEKHYSDPKTEIIVQILGEYKIDAKSISPAKLQVAKGQLKVNVKPLEKEITDQYERSLVPHAIATGSVKGFEKFIRDERISTDALMQQVKKYKTIIFEETPTKLREFADLITRKETPWLGLGPAPKNLQEIEEENLAAVHDQLTSLLAGKT